MVNADSIVALALGYAELVQRVKELEAENASLRSLISHSSSPVITPRGRSRAVSPLTVGEEPGEAERFRAQVPRGSVVRDIPPDEPSTLELAAQQLQRNRIPRDEE